MNFFKETFFPVEPLVIPSPRNKRYLRKLLYILIGYTFTFLTFIFTETILASLLVLLQILLIVSSIYTYYYGMFAFVCAVSLMNLFYTCASAISKYNSTLCFIIVCVFIYSSYYSYLLYSMMKEQYNEQHSIAYKAYYQYIQRKVLQGREYIDEDLERMKLLGLFNPREEIQKIEEIQKQQEIERQALLNEQNKDNQQQEQLMPIVVRPPRDNLLFQLDSDEVQQQQQQNQQDIFN
eukprot:403346119